MIINDKIILLLNLHLKPEREKKEDNVGKFVDVKRNSSLYFNIK